MPVIIQSVARATTRATLSFCILAILYVVLILLLPADTTSLQTYDLSPWQYRVASLAMAFPVLLIWFIAFFGYAKLLDYATSIKSSPEGGWFGLLAKGSIWLAWSLPLSAIVVLLLNALANEWTGLRPAATILSNYTTLLFPLIAFSIIGTASRGLLNQARLQLSLPTIRVIMGVFVAAGVLFCYLTFRRFDLTSLSSTNNPYHLPIWLMVLTVIIPYLYAWFVGLIAAYEITLVSRHIRGVLYRNALRLIVGGLVAVIGSSIALQYMGGIEPTNGQLVLDYKLVFNLLFRFIGGLGFFLIAIGAMRLKRIEEV